ncbi:MAG: hypothetical protein QUS09_06865 [Methanotrichaceae archaeon]|nr:hypothetical protein [Methanotrichaceae archaeon]
MTKIYAGAVGVEIRLDTGQNLAEATSMKILVKRPNGTETEWTASQYDSTTIYYVTADGDLDASGDYVLQAYVEFGESSKHLGESVVLKVYAKYE